MSFNGIVSSISDIARTFPPHLLLSLIYRVAVLHLAAKIVPVIRKYSMGWDDTLSGDEKERPGFWDGRSLVEEPAVSDDRVPALLALREAAMKLGAAWLMKDRT
jgi:hypothetical protein